MNEQLQNLVDAARRWAAVIEDMELYILREDQDLLDAARDYDEAEEAGEVGK